MVRLLILCVVLLFEASGIAQPAASPAPRPKTEHVPGTLYIKFKKTAAVSLESLKAHATGIAEVDALLDRFSIHAVEEFDANAKNIAVCRTHGIDRMYVLYFQPESDVIAVAKAFRALKSIESVSPRFVFKPCYMPNDPQWGSQWGLKSNRMNLEQAWNSEKGDTNIIIAVLDGGVNYLHQDLEPNLAINWKETGLDKDGNDKRSNGKDDDGDGVKDNWRGWDLAGSGPSPKPDNDPMPDTMTNDHGTMVAGCAAARPDNGKGVAGAGFNCRLLPVKTGNAEKLYMGYEGIQYAASHGAKAIVCAWGGEIEEEWLEFLNNLIVAATDQGALVVASSGNQGVDMDNTPFYPASFPSVLSVGASTQTDKAAGFSNFGKSVDVFAPGENIITTKLPDLDSYGSASGTSFSAPYVGGLVGLMASKYPGWTPKFIARQIVETCDNVINPSNRTKYWGRVNAYRALTEPGYPGLIITGFSVDGTEGGTLDFINKQYTLDVKFKNVVYPGAVTVRLLRAGEYRPNQATAALGQIGTGEEKTGTFIFTRDSTDEGAGDTIKLVFYASGNGNPYKDTLSLIVEITDDQVWAQKSVLSIEHSVSLECYPNPANAAAIVRFSLSEPDVVRVAVIDMLGHEVVSTPFASYPEGIQEIDLDISAAPVGMYSYVLESQNGMRVAKQLAITR